MESISKKAREAIENVIEHIGEENLGGIIFAASKKNTTETHVVSTYTSMGQLGATIVGLILTAGTQHDWTPEQLSMMLAGITADVMREILGGDALFSPEHSGEE